MTPAQAPNEPGSLRLYNSSGKYNSTIAIATNFVANDNATTVDVHFETVPIKDSYSLAYIGADGTESAIVKNVPFANLKDNAAPK